MYAKIKWSKDLNTLLAYHEQKVSKGVARRIDVGNFLDNPEDLTAEKIRHRFSQFLVLSELETPRLLHASVNFHPDDSPGLSTEKLQNISREYVKAIGLDQQPFVVYEHTDAGHPHFHIIAPAVNSEGRRIGIPINRQYNRMVEALERKHHLTHRKQKTSSREHTSWLDEYAQKIEYGERPTVPAMARAIETVMDKYRFTPLEVFNSALREYNLQAKVVTSRYRVHEHPGLVYLVLDAAGDVVGRPIPSSRFYCQPTLPKLEKKFQENARTMEGPKAHLLFRIAAVAKEPYAGIRAYFSALSRRQISTIIHHDRTGRIHGLAYVDHENHCIFHESELPEACSARKVLTRFGLQDALPAVDPSKERVNPQGLTMVRQPEPHYELQPQREPEPPVKTRGPKRHPGLKLSVASELPETSRVLQRFKARERTLDAEKTSEKILPRRGRNIPPDF